MFKRQTKTCSQCNRKFVITGACSDYAFKIGGKYYCCYGHWLMGIERTKQDITAAKLALKNSRQDKAVSTDPTLSNNHSNNHSHQ